MAISIRAAIRALLGRDADTSGQSLTEPQTAASETGARARVGRLRRELAQHPSRGLTPARLYSYLEAAEAGDLAGQHELAADMEEKDPQIMSDLGKRRTMAAQLDWRIEPPPDATPAEQRATDQAIEIIGGLEVEDLVIDLGDGILHGWVNLTVPWASDGATRVVQQPQWVPHAHFRLHPDNQDRLTLRDGSPTGEALWPLGWVEHRHRAKSGYVARQGLLRVLCWPYLFQNYALGDLAELLEVLGIPVRLGKYPETATPAQRAALLRAITELGHSAAGIIPQSMALELLQAAQGSEGPFDLMLQWCERAKSKAILGGTLTTGTDQGSGAYALGQVHERGLMDLIANDLRQYAGSIRRYLLWPMAALNYGVETLGRAPRILWDTGDADDIAVMSEALPKLVSIGLPVPVRWAAERLRIPAPVDGEAVLASAAAVPAVATLTARLPGADGALAARPAPPTTAVDALAERMAAATRAPGEAIITAIEAVLEQAAADGLTLAEAKARLLAAYPLLPLEALAGVTADALAAAWAAGAAAIEDAAAAAGDTTDE